MKHFNIAIHSFAEIQAFVDLAIAQPFDVQVGNDSQTFDAKSLMAMFCLDYRRPLQVCVNCDDAAFRQFQKDAANFIA